MTRASKINPKDSLVTRMLVVVLGLYVLIATLVTTIHVWVEYRHQKAAITEDMQSIETANAGALALGLWALDEETLQATVEGILQTPPILGVSITSEKGHTVALGGEIASQGVVSRTGFCVDLEGLDLDDAIPSDESSPFEVFLHEFDITYSLEGKDMSVGRAKLYSNSSVIYRRMRLQVAMLILHTLLTLLAFALALGWAVRHYLGKPLQVLTDATGEISLDNLGLFSVDTQTSRRNEIKVFEETMTSMVANLHRSILDQQEAEKQVIELREKLVASERRQALGVLAGGVAHDLNNILGPIVGLPKFVDEVLAQAGSASEDDRVQARRDLALMAESAQRGAEVIKALQSLGRRGQTVMKVIDPCHMIRDCLNSNEVQALRGGHRDLAVTSKLGVGPLRVMGNATDLHRVFLNLLVNAVDAVDSDGEAAVEVEVESVTLPGDKLGYELIPAGEYVVVHVRDSGGGISDGLMRTLFEPFVTSKREARKGNASGGSGLGLSVVHAVVKDHRGYVDVESDVEGWTTVFSVYLPAVAGTAEMSESAGERAMELRGTEQILVVDDVPSQRMVARRCLERFGYSVVEAKNGREALTFFDGTEAPSSEVDLILLDMIMAEGFDGLDTYQAILDFQPDLKVVIVSGHAAEARARAAQALGAAWLSKPYRMVDLARAVRTKLDS